LPVFKRWQLNEKFYGALQVGRNLFRDWIR